METAPGHPHTAHPQLGQFVQNVVLDEAREEGVPRAPVRTAASGPVSPSALPRCESRAARGGGHPAGQVLCEGVRELLAVGGDQGEPLGQVLPAELGRVGDVGKARRVVAFEEGVQAAYRRAQALGVRADTRTTWGEGSEALRSARAVTGGSSTTRLIGVLPPAATELTRSDEVRHRAVPSP